MNYHNFQSDLNLSLLVLNQLYYFTDTLQVSSNHDGLLILPLMTRRIYFHTLQ